MIGLEYILNLYKMNSTELSVKLGIAKQNISRWFAGDRKIPDKYIPQLVEIFNINEDYFQKEIDDIDKLKLERMKIENDAELIEYEETDPETGETYIRNYNTLDETGYRILSYEIDKKELIRKIEKKLSKVIDDSMGEQEENYGFSNYEEAIDEASSKITIYEKFIDLETKVDKNILRDVMRALSYATSNKLLTSDPFVRKLTKLIRTEIDKQEKEREEYARLFKDFEGFDKMLEKSKEEWGDDV